MNKNGKVIYFLFFEAGSGRKNGMFVYETVKMNAKSTTVVNCTETMSLCVKNDLVQLHKYTSCSCSL